MSTSIKNLRQLAARDVKDHTAIFDSYVVLGRDIDYLAIKFGLDPENIVNLLEGYGERIRRQKPQVVGVEEVPCEDDADLSAKPDASRKEAPAAPERRKSKKRSSFPIRFGSTRKRNGLCFRKIRITILPDAAGWEICHGP